MFKRTSTLALLLGAILTLSSVHITARSVQTPDREMHSEYDSLTNFKPDYERQVEIKEVTIRRGGARFYLKQGHVTPVGRVKGRDYIVTFKGIGYFQMEPPIAAERVMTRSICGDSTIDWRIKEAVFVFADNTFEQLADTIHARPSSEKKHEDRLLRTYLENYTEDFGSDLMSEILVRLGQPVNSGFFVARFLDDRNNLMTFFYNPWQAESSIFYRRIEDGGRFGQVLVTQFGDPEFYNRDPWFSAPIIPRFESLVYDVDLTIDDSAYAHVVIEADFAPMWELGATLPVTLTADHSELQIHSLQNDTLDWLVDSAASVVVVEFDTLLEAHQHYSIKFEYPFPAKSRWLMASGAWLPRFDYTVNTTIIAQVSCPDTSHIFAPGMIDAPQPTESGKTYHFDFHSPRMNNWPVIIGKYLTAVDTTSLGIVITVASPLFDDSTKIVNLIDTLGARCREIVEFYQDFLGFAPTERLTLVGGMIQGDISRLGVVTLPYKYFTDTIGDLSRFMLAHQLARQWFGGAIALESYREQWLIDGLAAYCAIYYMEQSDLEHLGNFDSFLKWVTFMSEKVEGYDVPLWVGNRTGSLLQFLYRADVIPYKGAYLLHMLRFMMMDQATLDDSRFRALIYDFVHECSGRNASTSAFVELCSRHMGEDMNWFFRQYLHYGETPHYRWELTKNVEGQPDLVQIDVTTEKVPPGFRMIVPFAFALADGRQSLVNLDIRLPKQTFRLRLPGEPVDYRFNVYRAALCTDKEIKPD